ncbi:MAG: MoxR family ATPase [Deltaproteobacteria bacterium]|nr:MoxR family ATPase [Deltaproteobacteria bacterium]
MNVTSVIEKMILTVQKAFLGNREAVELAVCAFLAEGHLLIEDMPGVGKTTLARAMAAALGGRFSRIQFTSDLLPADILGISIWSDETRKFEFHRGPIFANIVLADEINRASPKTQSALLESMSERQVSQEGVTHRLAAPFMVIATQNAGESHGTYPLPESQLDRFAMRLQLGYAPAEVERQMILAGGDLKPDAVGTAVTSDELAAVATEIGHTHVSDEVLAYLMAIVNKTRESRQLNAGASPRGSIALFKCARAFARIQGRDFVIVDDIQKLAVPVLAHRLSSENDGVYAGGQVASSVSLLQRIIESTEVPV